MIHCARHHTAFKAYRKFGRWEKKGNVGNREENTLKFEHILLITLISFDYLIQGPLNNSDSILL
jgi:hypothetical protein